jgi:4-hydroxybenzoate polyprenyltransferase
MNSESRPSSKLLAYLRLFRLPNVFTAMADIAMGFCFTQADFSFHSFSVFLPLLVASSLMYTAGMVLNDVYDLEIDRQERPTRPLPSGKIDASFAKRLGFALLAAGVIQTALLAVLRLDADSCPLLFKIRPIVCAIALAGMILLYNRILKHTPFGPIAMGSCRMLNVLLGMSASPQPWTVWNLIVAGGIGIYIAGVTWFARTEATTSNRGQLIGALIVVVYGLGTLWQWPDWGATGEILPLKIPAQQWTMLWIIVGTILIWRFLRAVVAPSPKNVQTAVKAGILGIIALDAATAFLVAGPISAIAIFLLIIPTLVLGAWVYST